MKLINIKYDTAYDICQAITNHRISILFENPERKEICCDWMTAVPKESEPETIAKTLKALADNIYPPWWRRVIDWFKS